MNHNNCRKSPKISNTFKVAVNTFEFELGQLIIHLNLKDADKIANSVDPDQTAPEEQSDLGLHCLLKPLKEHFGILDHMFCPGTWSRKVKARNRNDLLIMIW